MTIQDFMLSLPLRERDVLRKLPKTYRMFVSLIEEREQLKEVDELKEEIRILRETINPVREWNTSSHKSVAKICLKTGKILQRFESMSAAAKDVNCSVGSIRRVIDGFGVQIKGYGWRAINKVRTCKRCGKMKEFDGNFRKGKTSRDNANICLKCEPHRNKALRNRLKMQRMKTPYTKAVQYNISEQIYKFIDDHSENIKNMKGKELSEAIMFNYFDKKELYHKVNEFMLKPTKINGYFDE